MNSEGRKYFLYNLIGYAGGFVYKLLALTWKYSFHCHEGVEPVDFYSKNPARSIVCAHWHGDELALIGLGMRSKFLTFSSKSRDGAIMAAALQMMGFSVIRGSSSLGGIEAMVRMIRLLRKERFLVSFAIDGPRGPRHKAKPGAYMIAYKLYCPMIQYLVACDRKWVLKRTWNQCYIPKPFARIELHAYPIPQAAKDNREEIIALCNSRTEIR
jgi:lysophospholipid acyltransferase (LPLAT)-like uncharacterized protein